MLILDEDDLSEIIEEILPIGSKYYDLGRSLNLKTAELRKIRDKSPRESDALEDVLLLWLNREYNVKKHGPPTWRMLVEAVNKKSGGDNHELAKQIASNHPAGTNIIWTIVICACNAIANWHQAYAPSLHVSLHIAGSSTASMPEDVNKQKACEGDYLKDIIQCNS